MPLYRYPYGKDLSLLHPMHDLISEMLPYLNTNSQYIRNIQVVQRCVPRRLLNSWMEKLNYICLIITWRFTTSFIIISCSILWNAYVCAYGFILGCHLKWHNIYISTQQTQENDRTKKINEIIILDTNKAIEKRNTYLLLSVNNVSFINSRATEQMSDSNRSNSLNESLEKK